MLFENPKLVCVVLRLTLFSSCIYRWEKVRCLRPCYAEEEQFVEDVMLPSWALNFHVSVTGWWIVHTLNSSHIWDWLWWFLVLIFILFMSGLSIMVLWYHTCTQCMSCLIFFTYNKFRFIVCYFEFFLVYVSYIKNKDERELRRDSRLFFVWLDRWRARLAMRIYAIISYSGLLIKL